MTPPSEMPSDCRLSPSLTGLASEGVRTRDYQPATKAVPTFVSADLELLPLRT